MRFAFGFLCSLIMACAEQKVTDSGTTTDTGVNQPTSETAAEPGTEDSADTADTTDTNEPSTEPEECIDQTVGRRLLRRLTRDEFEMTVRRVFDLDEQTWNASDLPPDSAAENGFSNNADRLSVSTAFASGIETAAKAAGTTISTEPKLSTLLPCAVQGDLSCAETYLEDYGRLLFRRSLTQDEKDRYLSILEEFPSIDFPTWVRVTTSGLLQSPYVLYRSELGTESQDDAGVYLLDSGEVATALAYTYTGGPPSTELLDAAATGSLDSAIGRVDAARSLVLGTDNNVSDPFRDRFLDFSSRWLGYISIEGLSKDPVQFDGFNGDIAFSMRQEADTFFENVVLRDRGSIPELLTHSTTWVDAPLVTWYDLSEGPGEVTRFEGWGKGMLSLGAVMTVQATANATSPTQRGVNVRKRLFCQEPPPPPVDIPELPAATEANTTRERYELLHAPGSCQTCHTLFDPIGFAFEHIDATGRYRADENGYTIDTTGSITAFWPTGEEMEDQLFDGPSQLADVLVQQERIAPCFSSYAASYSFGVGNEEASCLVHDATTQFANGDIDIVELFIQFAASEHFAMRRHSALSIDPTEEPSAEPTSEPTTEPSQPASEPSQPTSEPSSDTAEEPATCGTECYALPNVAASDEWCQLNCLHDPPFCPPELCECEDIPCD